MKLSTIIKSLILFCLVLVSCSSKPEYELALTNVQIFDSKQAKVISNQSVYINADTIALITPASEKHSALKTIEGSDKLLIPGFIDTHVHSIGNYGAKNALPKDFEEDNGLKVLRDLTSYHYMNHGVTTIIDMGQPEEWIDITLDWQQHPSSKHPNMFICGGSMVSDEDRNQPAHHIEVMNPDSARVKVREYASRGLKYMKLYSKLRKPDYEAMADEAQKQGIIINSHVDNNVMTISEAMDAGVRNFEHFFTLSPSILDYETHWPLMNKMYGIEMSPSIDEFAAQMTYFFGYIKANPEYESKLLALFDRMASEGANLSTAINVLASASKQTDYFTSFNYNPIRDTPNVNYSKQQQDQLEEAFKSMMSYAKIAHDKGVKLRIGTDCRGGGRAFLSELQIFVKHGFSLEEALQIATINGYESMQLDDKYGSIEVGKKADFVLFENNPFESIDHLLSDKVIIKDGVVQEKLSSIAFDFHEIAASEGITKATQFFSEAQNDTSFSSLNVAELRYVVKQLMEGEKFEESMASMKLFKSSFPDKEVKFDNVELTNLAYTIVRKKDKALLNTFMDFWSKYFPNEAQYVGLNIYQCIENKSIEEANLVFNKIYKDKRYVLEEGEINGVGYLYLYNSKEIEKAKAVFEMNVKAFPQSWGVYDSLAEYYMVAGDKATSKRLYLKSLELNPDNENGKMMLKKL